MTKGLVSNFGVLLAALFIVGCGDDYAGREAVSGTVTLKGEPLKQGSIQFQPADGQDTIGGCGIVDGKFSIARRDGLKPGKYVVRITSGDGVTLANEDDAGGPGGSTNIVSFDRIPDDWNTASKQQIEVKAGDKNEFPFAIPNAREPKKKR